MNQPQGGAEFRLIVMTATRIMRTILLGKGEEETRREVGRAVKEKS
jgi:hypothetical protein